MNEFTIGKRGFVHTPKLAENILRSRFFLKRLKQLRVNEALYAMTPDKLEQKKILSRFRTRLWRYAESKNIGYREFSVRVINGGIKVIRNLDPLENFKKRNLKKEKETCQSGLMGPP